MSTATTTPATRRIASVTLALVLLIGAVGPAAATADSGPDNDPVLFVHGFFDTHDTPWWDLAEHRLVERGYDPGNVHVLDLGSIPGTTVHSPEDYAQVVCDRVQEIAAETGSEVDIVAHSMGGLDSRYCVEKLGGNVHVDDLITLGTPHQGTYAAYLAYLTPGGYDMVPGSDFLTDLNDGTLAKGVEYTAIWSDSDEIINPDEYAKLPAGSMDSVAEARNINRHWELHLQLAWDEDVFEVWYQYLD
ncbi:esterase/lipase family protein [Haloarchaeobius sp. TZWSO28]|uniref:esterase/lipase family protein n=1 Tax=unclassified Haloarchaeobius TaxID=2614452 RepID=UPI003EB9A2F9